MKKLYILILAIFLTIPAGFCSDELRGYAPLLLRKGTLLKVVNQREISTAIADEGDIVTFINPTDVWLGEAKVLPKETILEGFVEELNEPIQGTNGALKIKISKAILPDNTELPIDGYITHKGDSTIGGELTAPMEYAKMPHYIYYPRVYKGVLQFVPGNKRFFGQHTVIKPGAELVLELESDFHAIGVDY